jgi:hypothetical protein
MHNSLCNPCLRWLCNSCRSACPPCARCALQHRKRAAPKARSPDDADSGDAGEGDDEEAEEHEMHLYQRPAKRTATHDVRGNGNGHTAAALHLDDGVGVTAQQRMLRQVCASDSNAPASALTSATKLKWCMFRICPLHRPGRSHLCLERVSPAFSMRCQATRGCVMSLQAAADLTERSRGRQRRPSSTRAKPLPLHTCR